MIEPKNKNHQTSLTESIWNNVINKANTWPSKQKKTRPDGTWRRPEHRRAGWAGEPAFFFFFFWGGGLFMFFL